MNVKSRLLNVITRNAIGLKFPKRVVIINQGSLPAEKLSFIVSGEGTINTLILGLKRNSRYLVSMDSSKVRGIEVISNREGAVSFDMELNGICRISVEKKEMMEHEADKAVSASY